MDKIAILIPCLNEEKTIAKVVKDCLKALPEAKVYVYDNNSTDNTISVAKNAGAIIRHEFERGKGNVVRRMFREIDAECYVMIDGDDTYDANASKEMVELVRSHGADMVVGDRLSSTYFSENNRPFHGFGNSLVRNAVNLLFRTNVKDVMTGHRAFSYNFVKTFPVTSGQFEIETEMSIWAKSRNMSVYNVIIDYKDRPAGSASKLNTYVDGLKVLGSIIKLYMYYRPLEFLGLISIISFLSSVILYFVSTIYSSVNIIFLTLSTGMVLFGFFSFFTGLTLRSLAYKDRQDFEGLLQSVNSQYIEKRKIKTEKSR